MTSVALKEQAAAYVLGALEPDEIERFEEALMQSAELREEVGSLRNVAALLALAAPPAQPSPGVRERILEHARTVRPIASRRMASSTKAEMEPTPAPAAQAPTLVVTEGKRATAPFLQLMPWLAVAASLYGAVVMRNRYVEERNARVVLEQRIDSARGMLAARDSLVQTLLAPDVETARLVSSGRPPSARMYWNRATGRVIFAAFSLPPAPAGRTYQLWGMPGPNQTPVSLGTFNTAASGEVRVTFSAPAGLEINIGAVTEEPAGGSVQPTTTPFLVGTFAS